MLKSVVNIPGVGGGGEMFVAAGDEDNTVMIGHKDGKVALYDVEERAIQHTWYTPTGEKVVDCQAGWGVEEKVAAVVIKKDDELVFATKTDSKLETMNKLKFGSKMVKMLVYNKEILVVFRSGCIKTLNYLKKHPDFEVNEDVIGEDEELKNSWIGQDKGITRIIHQIETKDKSIQFVSGQLLIDPDTASVSIVNNARNTFLSTTTAVACDVLVDGQPTVAVLQPDGFLYTGPLDGGHVTLTKVCQVAGVDNAGVTWVDKAHVAVMSSREGGMLQLVNVMYRAVVAQSALKTTVHSGRGIWWVEPHLYLTVGARVVSVEVEGLEGGLDKLLGSLAVTQVENATLTLYSVIPDLIKKGDSSELAKLITNTADIPESLLLDCIKFFLSQSELRREAQVCYLGLLLSRGFSDAVMSDELRKVSLSDVVKLLEVLNSLMHDPAGTECSQASLLDWMSLVLNSHYLQLVVTNEANTVEVLEEVNATIKSLETTTKMMVETRTLVHTILNTNLPTVPANNHAYCIEIIQI